MTDRTLMVVCAWCQCVMTAPPSAAGVTHTICPTCLASMLDGPASEPTPPAEECRVDRHIGGWSRTDPLHNYARKRLASMPYCRTL